jgi:uncharacterized membrane protein HdeD (DUF308 family)
VRLLIGLGVVACAVGVVWIGQGVGLIGGSFMTGRALWAVVGALALITGILLIRVGVRAGRSEDKDQAPPA